MRHGQLIRDEVNKGQRAYVVLPLVEDSEKMDLRSAVEVHRQLAEEVFPIFRWVCCMAVWPVRTSRP